MAKSDNSTVDQVVEYIEDKIRGQELRSGDRIPAEGELCEILNVSRTSVREAIKALEAMTVIKVKRGDGTYISSPEDISFYGPLLFKMLLMRMTWSEIVEFRERIEFAVAESVIEHASTAEIERVAQAHAHMMKKYEADRDDDAALAQLDADFHNTLGRVCHNRMLEMLYRFTSDILQSVTQIGYAEGTGQSAALSIDNHRILVDSLRCRDVFMMKYAVQNSMNNWKRGLENQRSNLFSFDEMEEV